MDDLLSRVTIDPLAIKYPSRGETASAGLVVETTVSGCLDNLDGRVTALEGAPAGGGGAFVAVLGIPVDGDNTYSAGPVDRPPVMVQVMRGGVVVNFIRPPVGMPFSSVSNVGDATAFAYFSQNAGALGGFTFVNGGITIEHSVAVPAAGQYWLPSGATTAVTLFY